MRIFHSLWTKPALDKRWDLTGLLEANIWLYALSVLYAKSLGLEIVLHTDSFGKALLSHLPYDHIYTTLDKIPATIPTMIWAYGKFMAYKEEELGNIHIDGDVFLKKPKILNSLKFDNYSLLIQNKETLSDSYTKVEELLKQTKVIESDFVFPNHAYNCGIVGFNDSKLKQKYLELYFKYTNAVSKTPSLIKKMLQDRYFCVDLPLEQHLLAALGLKYTIKELLTDDGKNGFAQGSDIATDIGYQHLIGKDKYYHIDRVKFNVLVLNLDIYFKTKKIIEKYKTKIGS